MTLSFTQRQLIFTRNLHEYAFCVNTSTFAYGDAFRYADVFFFHSSPSNIFYVYKFDFFCIFPMNIDTVKISVEGKIVQYSFLMIHFYLLINNFIVPSYIWERLCKTIKRFVINDCSCCSYFDAQNIVKYEDLTL